MFPDASIVAGHCCERATTVWTLNRVATPSGSEERDVLPLHPEIAQSGTSTQMHTRVVEVQWLALRESTIERVP
jgi:hypothetical protein